jgi:hypothetical protein
MAFKRNLFVSIKNGYIVRNSKQLTKEIRNILNSKSKIAYFVISKKK